MPRGFFSGPAGVKAARPADQPGGGGSTPTAGLFRKGEWEVRPCPLIVAQKMVEREHYSHGGSNTGVFSFGLYKRPSSGARSGLCLGVSWWLPPTRCCAAKHYPEAPNKVLSLSRLVVEPGVPKNACSFLIRKSMRFIDRSRWPMLISYADEWQGHEGTIYKAAGWKEGGWTKPERCYVKDGRMVSRKAGPKTRTHAEMITLGCECVGSFRKKLFYHKVGG